MILSHLHYVTFPKYLFNKNKEDRTVLSRRIDHKFSEDNRWTTRKRKVIKLIETDLTLSKISGIRSTLKVLMLLFDPPPLLLLLYLVLNTSFFFILFTYKRHLLSILFLNFSKRLYSGVYCILLLSLIYTCLFFSFQ